MHTNTPKYMKRMSLLVLALILPFYVVVAMGGLHPAWLWSQSIMKLWAAYLPLLAALLAIGTYGAFLLHTGNKNASFAKRIKSLKYTWQFAVPSILAIGTVGFVFFHDSAHCLLQNPVYTMVENHQALQCVESGFSSHII